MIQLIGTSKNKVLNFVLIIFCLSYNLLFGQDFAKNPTVNIQVAPCVNEGFESTIANTYTGATNSVAVTGWTISSAYQSTCGPLTYTPGSPEFRIGVVPAFGFAGLGLVPAPPTGGNVVAVLNSSVSNYSATRISQVFPVTSANAFFNYAYALCFKQSIHGCCGDPMASVIFRDAGGNIIPCISQTFQPNCYTNLSYTLSGGLYFANWQTRSADLTAYIGQNILVEVTANDCVGGEHFGYMLFDSQCSSSALFCNCNNASNNYLHVNWCAGQTQAVISASAGTNYNWAGPTAISQSQATTNPLVISNPIAGNIYTVSYINPSGCPISQAYTLGYTSVANGPYSVGLDCQPNSTGSATIFPTGSGQGYNAIWQLNGNVVATGTQVSNMPGGLYQVTVSASNCGSFATTVSIPSYSTSFNLMPGPYYLCTGDTAAIGLSYSGSSANYSFSWAPQQFASAVNPTLIVVTPTNSPGAISSQAYSITCTTLANSCAVTKTVLVVSHASVVPNLPALQKVCIPGNNYTLQATPGGGVFSGNNFVSASGIVTANISSVGTSTYAYSIGIPNCNNTSTASLLISTQPTISIVKPSALCIKGPAIVTANGASQYTWSVGVYTNSMSILPPVTATLLVTGIDTITSCSITQSLSINYLVKPSVGFTGDTMFCSGKSANFIAFGASTYLWDSNFNSQGISFVPTSSGTISLIGFGTNNCNDTTVVKYHLVNCTNLQEDYLEAPFNVYYRWDGNFVITVANQGAISIFDLYGKLQAYVMNQASGELIIGAQDWSEGLYLFSFTNADGTISKKIIKTRQH